MIDLPVHGGPADGQTIPWCPGVKQTIVATHYGPPDEDGWRRLDAEAHYRLTPIGWVWDGRAERP